MNTKLYKVALSGIGAIAGAASAVLAFFPTPLATFALAIAALGLLANVASTADWFIESQETKRVAFEHGLHYLLHYDK